MADLGERTQTGGARPVPVKGTPVLASRHADPRRISAHRRRNATLWPASRARLAVVALLLCSAPLRAQRPPAAHINATQAVREIDTLAEPSPIATTAIVGATLIDGRGGPALANAVVVVRGSRIIAVGSRAATVFPAGATIIDGNGRTLMPGLIDAHFHLDGDDALPALFLSHGVTSVRDPGAWIEAYANVRRAPEAVPRLFLAGPHLDGVSPAYPNDALVVRDADETRRAVDALIAQGASVIKAYFRLPPTLLRVVVRAAHARGVPVTTHLELVDGGEAIRAGVDGVEHITSFGTALLPPRDAERYRQSVMADNNARRDGRYTVWSAIDLTSPRVVPLLRLIATRGTFISPTLAVFEKQASDSGATAAQVRAFAQMLAFTGMVKRAGGHIVVGSHSSVPHAERGWAYQRELELLVAAGLTPMEAIVAGTRENAAFFRVGDRLGTIAVGKLADLVLVRGDPLQDITRMRQLDRVMLNGRWVVAK
jgi:imidazolonepropionase-like amidohydrolase